MKQSSDGSVFTIALMFGLGLIYLSCGDIAVLTCDRDRDSCQFVEKNFWRSVSKDFPIRDLKGAKDEYVPDGLPYVQIDSSQGEIILESWGNPSMIDEIKTFANNPEPRFLEIKTYPWSSWWTGGLLFGPSSFVFLLFLIYSVKSLIYVRKK